jgi:hypothetical protein
MTKYARVSLVVLLLARPNLFVGQVGIGGIASEVIADRDAARRFFRRHAFVPADQR